MIKTRLSTYVPCALLAGVLLFPATSNAQQCLLGPVALPALSGGPEWEDFDGDGKWRPELHDPRWSGAPLDALTFLPSTGSPSWVDDVVTRVVADGKIVYISFQAQTDDTGPDALDYVYVGISQGSVNGAYALKINADGSGTSIAAPADPDGAGPIVVPQDSPLPKQLSSLSFSYWHTADATAVTPNWGSEQSTALTWVKAARWDRPVLKSPRWGITLRLDLSPTGLNIAGDTKIFLGAAVHNSTGDVIVGNATPKLTTDTDKVGDTVIPWKSSQWVNFSEPGTACTAGITLSSSDVGVWTGAPGATSGGSLTNQICTGGATCATTENVFRVTARHVDNTTGIGTWQVRARTRIAAWGSTVAYWNYGLWKDISAVPTGTNIFTDPAANLSTTNGWTWLTPVDAGDGTSAVTIDYKCNKGADPYCPHLADPSMPHQCMLVELGQPSSPLPVRNNAVYRNMDYADLSTSTVPATISIEGLKAAIGEAKDRDVYLYIESHNLPPHGDKAFSLPREDMVKARQFAEHPITPPRAKLPPPNPGQGKLAVLGKGALAGKGPTAARAPAPAKGPVAAGQKPAVVAAAAAAPGKPSANEIPGKVSAEGELAGRIAQSTATFSNGLPERNVLAMSSDQLLDAVWPTYRVRVYYDSGKTFTTGGHTNKVLVPMVPFGFRLNHAGALYGFTHALTAMPGFAVQQISPDWYKISLKSEGSANVQTKITAEESPLPPPNPCPGGPGCKPPPGPGPMDHGHCNCTIVGSSTGGLAAFGAIASLAALAFVRRRRPAKRRETRAG